MAAVPRPRRSPWVGGALLLAATIVLVGAAAYALGLERWPLRVGLAALLLLAFGAVERFWKSRPLPRRQRIPDRSRFRVVTGGKDKGDGHARDVPEGGRPEDGDDDKPRWVM